MAHDTELIVEEVQHTPLAPSFAARRAVRSQTHLKTPDLGTVCTQASLSHTNPTQTDPAAQHPWTVEYQETAGRPTRSAAQQQQQQSRMSAALRQALRVVQQEAPQLANLRSVRTSAAPRGYHYVSYVQR